MPTDKAAYEYIALGLAPIPIPHGSKNPDRQGWQKERLSAQDVPERFSSTTNIGILLGNPSNGLVDVDLDCDEAVVAARILLATNLVSGRESRPQSHRFFRCKEEIKTQKYCDFEHDTGKVGSMLVEIRSTGAQTLVPPSKHPSGEFYHWDSFGEATEIQAADLRRKVGLVAAATMLGRHWPENGTRHSITLPLVGFLLQHGFPVEHCEELLRAVLKIAGDGETEDRIRCVRDTKKRIDDGTSVTGYPTLAEVLGEKVTAQLARRLTDWLDVAPLRGQLADETSSTAARDTVDAALSVIKKGDLKAAFEREFLLSAATLKDVDLGSFEESRSRLKKAKVRIGEWDKALNRLVAAARRESKQKSAGKIPFIPVNEIQLREKVRRAWNAVIQRNQPAPRLFQRHSSVVRIGRSGGIAKIETVSETRMYGEIARSANWFLFTKDGMKEANPDKDVSRDMLVFPDSKLPPLELVINCPIFTSAGDLIQETGYHEEHALYFDPKNAITVDVPEQPSAEDLDDAKLWLLEELLSDFPFVSESDRTHAIAAIILPFARQLVTGCTPLHAINAPTPGTGKSLLCNLISIIARGTGTKAQTIPREDDEFRKRITSFLEKSPAVVLLDNADRQVDSAALSSVLTSEYWTDRRLGHSQMITAKNFATWLITGNNLKLSSEIGRRSIWIRLDAECSEPWKRSEFRHNDLTTWARQHRERLVRSVLILIQNWIAKGRPGYPHKLGSFERWSDVMGGIVECAGLPCFLTTEVEDYDQFAWAAFGEVWSSKLGMQPRRVRELLEFCLQEHLLPEVLGDGSERSQVTRLGKALLQRSGCMLGDHRLELAADGGHKGKHYRLIPTSPGPASVGEPLGNLRGTSTSGGSPSETATKEQVTSTRGTWGTFSRTQEPLEKKERSCSGAKSGPVQDNHVFSPGEAPTREKVPQVPPTSINSTEANICNGEPSKTEVPQRFPQSPP